MNFFNRYSVLVILILLLPQLGYAQWVIQTTLDGDPPLHRVRAVDNNIVWICSSNGYTYRTTDSGKNWRRTAHVTTTETIFFIEPVDSLTAFVGGGGYAGGGGNANRYRTTDGGQSWQVVVTAAGSNSFWNWIHFFDDQNGIAMSDPLTSGAPFYIVKTADGGTTWTPIANPPSPRALEFGWINAFQFYDTMNGWFGTAGTLGGRIFRPTDGGETWQGAISGSRGPIWSVNFVSATTGVRTSGSSIFLTRSTDGGQSWTEVSGLPVTEISVMRAGASASNSGKTQIWICGEGASANSPFMLTSTDSGRTWQQQNLPLLSGNSIQSLSAVTWGDSVRVWAVTLDHSNFSLGGQILTYEGELGVITDVEERPTVTVSDYRLEQNYPNPFNPQTRIQYEVSSPARVVLKILNLLGQEIRTLVNEGKPAGNYEVVWDGRDAAGQRVASGVYLYRFEAAGLVQTRKMVLLQ